MKKLIVSLIAVLGIAVAANAANYKVDNNAIDALIETSSEVFTAEFMTPAPVAAATVAPASGEINNIVALVLSWFLGEFGIHRYYLGCGSSAPWLWAVYTFTAGGFGVLWGVDTILIFLDVIGAGQGYIAKFINNEKIIVWI